jgi:cytochrome P450
MHPGLANLMTFSFGPHSCPGWKFTILEMKIFLATILPLFTFSPAEDIRKYNSILTRPYVYEQWEQGPRLPIRVGRFVHA